MHLRELIVSLLVVSSASVAEANERRPLRVGDTFVTKGMQTGNQWMSRIAEVGPSTIVSKTDTPQGSVSTYTWTTDLQLLSQEDAKGLARWMPYRPDYVFPLDVGKTWVTSYSYTGPDGRYDRSRSCKVEGIVPFTLSVSGTPETLNVTYFSCKDTWRDRVTDIEVWYSPKLNWTVKVKAIGFNQNWELVSFTPGP